MYINTKNDFLRLKMILIFLCRDEEEQGEVWYDTLKPLNTLNPFAFKHAIAAYQTEGGSCSPPHFFSSPFSNSPFLLTHDLSHLFWTRVVPRSGQVRASTRTRVIFSANELTRGKYIMPARESRSRARVWPYPASFYFEPYNAVFSPGKCAQGSVSLISSSSMSEATKVMSLLYGIFFSYYLYPPRGTLITLRAEEALNFIL